MPYRRAWLFIAALIALSVFAFWRNYFGRLAEASGGFHLHGITASFWMLLLLAQGWTPHRGQMAVHRLTGRATFVAIPLFAAGSMAVIHSMAVATVGGDPFYALWGAPLGLIDLLAFGAVLYGAGMALRHRRSVRLHAGYMLSTALPLVSPVLGRAINRSIPGLQIRGPADFPLFGWGAQLGNLTAAVIALWLWRRDPRYGRPWAVAFAVIAVQLVGFRTLGEGDAWERAFRSVADIPLPLLLGIGLAIGIATVAVGWTSAPPRRGTRPVAA